MTRRTICRPSRRTGARSAYFAMARPTYEADRQVLMLRDLASRPGPRADAGLGPLGRFHRLGRRRQEPGGDRRRHAGRAGVPRRCPHRQGHAPDPGRPCRQRPAAAQRRRALHLQLRVRAGRPLSRHIQGPDQPADQRQPRPAAPSSTRSPSTASASPAPMATRSGASRSSRPTSPASCRSPSSSTAGRRAASATPGPTAGTRACSLRPAMASSASISTARLATARPSRTRSRTIGAAGRSRICRRASPSPPRRTRSSTPTMPALWAPATAAT